MANGEQRDSDFDRSKSDQRGGKVGSLERWLAIDTLALTPRFSFTIAIVFASAVLMALVASMGRSWYTTAIAAMFTLFILASAIATNARSRKAGDPANIQRTALRATTVFTTLLYVWGSAALFAIYLGTPIRWQHGWQYATLMGLIAVGHAVYLRQLAKDSTVAKAAASVSRAVILAAMQGIAAAITLVWLIASGKLATRKGDWAANDIFVAGLFTLVCLSALIVATNMRLSRPH